MSSAIRLQEFLSIVDPGLFFCIKTIRRALEILQFDWVITGHLAINLYSYMAGLQPISTKTLVAEIYINRFSKSDLLIEGEFKELILYLEQLGFIQEKSSLEFIHPYSTTRFRLNLSSDPSLFDNQYRVWIRNKIGKSTYPLLDPLRLERQQLRQISYLSVDKKNAEQAEQFASYPLVDTYQNNMSCYLTIDPPRSEEISLIAPPLLLPSERSAGLSIYEWTKYVISESLLTTDEISLPSRKNRITQTLTITTPRPVTMEKPTIIETLQKEVTMEPVLSKKEEQLRVIRERAQKQRAQKAR